MLIVIVDYAWGHFPACQKKSCKRKYSLETSYQSTFTALNHYQQEFSSTLYMYRLLYFLYVVKWGIVGHNICFYQLRWGEVCPSNINSASQVVYLVLYWIIALSCQQQQHTTHHNNKSVVAQPLFVLIKTHKTPNF